MVYCSFEQMDYFWFMCVEMHCSYYLLAQGSNLWLRSKSATFPSACSICTVGGIPGLAVPWVLAYVAEIWFGVKSCSLICFVFLALRWVSWDCASVWFCLKSSFDLICTWMVTFCIHGNTIAGGIAHLFTKDQNSLNQ